MTETIVRRRAGAHRKQGKSIKGRIAMVALTSSAVSMSGAATAAATDDSGTDNRELRAQEAPQALSTTPTILAAQDFRPASDLNTQLATALEYNFQRTLRDRLARAPHVSRPAEGTFTSGFGPRWGSFHSGIDIANGTNTPILAVMSGQVIDSGDAQGYGQWIRILHDDGAITVYGHLETLGVAVGERVAAGQWIGGMGNRGFSTGTHLHFEILPDGVNAVDPVPWFEERGITIS